MPRTRAIKILVIAVCAGGIVGMIVTSATDHNGAAITFGLVTAVAVLCQMVATTVVNELTGAPGAPIAGPWAPAGRGPPAAPQPPPVEPPPVQPPTPASTAAPTPVPTPAPTSEEEAEEVEARINSLVVEGSDETAVRDLVRRAVRLGRRTATAAAPDS